MKNGSSHLQRVGFSIRNIVLLVLIGVVLYFGAFWQIFDSRTGTTGPSDVDKYQCYVVAFWHGEAGLRMLPAHQCQFLTASIQPMHTLPKEYPFLVLLPLSLPLILPISLYKVGFALLMFLILCYIFVIMNRLYSRRAGFVFLFYMVLGCLGTAEGRFDLLPSALTLIALIAAERRRWNWAFVLLALATLLKLYPLFLVLPFFVAQQKQVSGRWLSWRRAQCICLFFALCIIVSCISLLLSVDGTLGPFSYFIGRPLQIESLSASLVWLVGIITHSPMTYVYSFGSRNIVGPFSPFASTTASLLLIIGLLFIAWLQWQRDISLSAAALLTLLVVLLTGKVLSAQYLIWVAPFVAYVGKDDWRWLVDWGCISLLTTLIYPFLYEQAHFPFLSSLKLPPLLPTILVRNLVLLLFTLILLWRSLDYEQKSIPSSDS